MKPVRRSIAVTVSLLGVSLASLVAAGAAGAVVTCGTVITANTVLTNDVGPCSSDGLIVGADNITLTLGGHTVFGVPNTPGNGVGIHSTNHSGVTIQAGTVKQFDAGIAFEGGSGNTVQAMNLNHNVGSSATDFGDGVALSGSNNNTIRANSITFNGPYDGVGMFNGANNNKVLSNSITDNNFSRTGGPHGTTIEDDGVRMEPTTNHNLVQGNDIERNGLDGVAAFFQSPDNTITSNNIVGNGFHDPIINRLGDGIHLFPQADRTLVQGNVIRSNARFGLAVESNNNQLLRNVSLGQSADDLLDTNSNCDANAWHGNIAVAVDPPCTLNP